MHVQAIIHVDFPPLASLLRPMHDPEPPSRKYDFAYINDSKFAHFHRISHKLLVISLLFITHEYEQTLSGNLSLSYSYIL